MKYRQAVIEDIQQMSDIRLSVSENILSDPSKVTLAMYEDYLDRLGRGWVCETDNKIVGFAYAAKSDHSIWALFVNPKYQGLGIGKELLKKAVDWLFDLGALKIILSTDANTNADRFYLAQGWLRGHINDEFEVSYSLINPTVI